MTDANTIHETEQKQPKRTYDDRDNAGPWAHNDGTPCPAFWADRPTAESGELWWCTEHQQHLISQRATTEQVAPTVVVFAAEDDLFEYLDQSLNANGLIPQMSGYDKDGQPFMAWLDEDGGDSVAMLVTRLTINDGGTTSTPVTEYVDSPIRSTADAYPVSMLCLAVKS